MVGEFQRIFHDLFGQRGDIYRKIVAALAKQSLSHTELAKKLGYAKGSALSGYLHDLEICGYIKENPTWSFKTGKLLKLSRYHLSDLYLRFYFKYIAPKIAGIQRGQYTDVSVSQLPGWKSMLGLQYENFVLNNSILVREALGIKQQDIVMDGPCFQRTTVREPGYQVDYLIQTKLNTLFICEIKFSASLNAGDIIKKAKEKMSKIKIPRGFAILPVMICFGEADDSLEEYFYRVIDFSRYFTQP